MKNFLNSLEVEIIKTIKSPVFIGSIIFSIFADFMPGLIFYIVKNPEFAQNSVIIRAKASIVGNADWKTFFDFLILFISIIGYILFGFITSWIFGREYADKTINDILSLPISRNIIIISKFIVLFLWSLIIGFIIFISGISIVFLVGLDGNLNKILLNNLIKYIIVIIMNILSTTIFAFFACYGKGYILALALIILILFITNFAINISDNAKYIPWAVSLLYAGASLKKGFEIDIYSIIILFITGLVGFLATIFWFKYSDQ